MHVAHLYPYVGILFVPNFRLGPARFSRIAGKSRRSLATVRSKACVPSSIALFSRAESATAVVVEVAIRDGRARWPKRKGCAYENEWKTLGTTPGRFPRSFITFRSRTPTPISILLGRLAIGYQTSCFSFRLCARCRASRYNTLLHSFWTPVPLSLRCRAGLSPARHFSLLSPFRLVA